jgi:uncharacterized protein YfaP (DUF2135 family)
MKRFSIRIISLLTIPFVLLAVGVAQAPTLEAGVPTRGVLTPMAPAATHTFSGQPGDTVGLTAASENGAPIGLVLARNDGVVVAQAIDDNADGTAAIMQAFLPDGGAHVVTVYSLAPLQAEAPYTITLSVGAGVIPEPVEATAAPEATVTSDASADQPVDAVREAFVSDGVAVELSWQAPVDLNLEIRDPNGESLFWNSRTTSTGGVFGFDANALCVVLEDAPVETATWPEGILPSGSYEVLVFYRQGCNTTEPADFTLNMVINGEEMAPVTGTLPAPSSGDSVFVLSYSILPDGSGIVRPGGVYDAAAISRLPAAADLLIGEALPLAPDILVEGTITNDAFFQSYAFDGLGNEVITLRQSRLDGSLDTLLQLIGPDGQLVFFNDDYEGTDSAIVNYPLPLPGTYTVVATRYGKDFGGTEGRYQLELTGASEDLPAEIISLDLPTGDIGVLLTWNTNADLQLLVRDPAGEAIFDDLPEAQSGGLLAADGNVGCVVGGEPISYIYWPTGTLRPGTYEVEVWYQNTCDDNRPVEFLLQTTVRGQVVQSIRQIPSPNQRFVTSFLIDANGATVPGPGGFIGGTETIPFDSEVPILIQIGETRQGTITNSNVFDVYAFDAAVGDEVTISMVATSSNLDTVLYLVDESGLVLAENDDASPASVGTTERTTNSVIAGVILPADGRYRIIATRFAGQYGGTNGGYSITVR